MTKLNKRIQKEEVCDEEKNRKNRNTRNTRRKNDEIRKVEGNTAKSFQKMVQKKRKET